MEDIVKILEKTDVIYDKKLDDAINMMENTSVDDAKFDKLLGTISSLVGLKMQKVEFINRYNEMEENK